MLFELQDTGYRDFHSKLVPGVDKERIIGVRTPALRKLAKEIAKMPEYETFLMETPHFYYEENNLHGMLIGLLYKDPAQALEMIFCRMLITGQHAICCRQNAWPGIPDCSGAP